MKNILKENDLFVFSDISEEMIKVGKKKQEIQKHANIQTDFIISSPEQLIQNDKRQYDIITLIVFYIICLIRKSYFPWQTQS